MSVNIGFGQDSENMTYNLMPMLGAAGLKDIEFLDGKTPLRVCYIMTKLIIELQTMPYYYRSFNPPNGWGTYECLIKSLEQIRRMSVLTNPRAKCWVRG